MNIFICFGCEVSKAAAMALRDWLPYVAPESSPWCSERDIGAGAEWGPAVLNRLKDSKLAILCLAPNSLRSPWLHFEAGAVAAGLDRSLVVPFLINLNASDLATPLSFYQAVLATRDGTSRLVNQINSLRHKPLDPTQLETVFDRLWPLLEGELRAAGDVGTEPQAPPRDQAAILEDLVIAVRGLIGRDSDSTVGVDGGVWKRLADLTESEVRALPGPDLVRFRNQANARRYGTASPQELDALTRLTSVADDEAQRRAALTLRDSRNDQT